VADDIVRETKSAILDRKVLTLGKQDLEHDIRTLGLVVDRVGEASLPPVVNLCDRTTASPPYGPDLVGAPDLGAGHLLSNKSGTDTPMVNRASRQAYKRQDAKPKRSVEFTKPTIRTWCDN